MLAIGQELWFVPHDAHDVRRSCIVRVNKIGRRWATLDNRGRVDLETLIADGGNFISPGRCWLSEGHWQAEQRRRAAWRELFDFIYRCHRPPDHLSEDAIQQILASLTTGQRGGERSE